MIEEIFIQLFVHAGKALFDRAMKPREANSPTIPQHGSVGDAVPDAISPTSSDAVARKQQYEVVRGVFSVQQEVHRAMRGHEEAVMLLLNKETQEHTVLGTFSLDEGFEIYIFPGTYWIHMALVDSRATNLVDAEIYAFGFPSRQYLPSSFVLDTPDDVWDLGDTSPTTISTGGGPYSLQFFVVGVEDLPGRPASFGDLEAIRDKNAEAWKPIEDPDREHVTVDEEGRLTPEAGYHWVNKRNAGDLRVKWHPGVDHPDHEHVIADDEEGQWTSEAGYDWVNKRNAGDLRVKWQPGVEHPDHEHVIADDEEGQWTAEAGYDWVNKSNAGDLRVKWQQGAEHPDREHVIAGDEEGMWISEAGYDWVNKRNAADLRVKWQPGVEHPDHEHVVADDEEGVWIPAPRYRWVNRRDSGDWRVMRGRSS